MWSLQQLYSKLQSSYPFFRLILALLIFDMNRIFHICGKVGPVSMVCGKSSLQPAAPVTGSFKKVKVTAMRAADTLTCGETGEGRSDEWHGDRSRSLRKQVSVGFQLLSSNVF